MKFLSKKIDPVRVLVGVVVAIVATAAAVGGWRRLNAPAWESLRPGMSAEQVVSVMGEPESRHLDTGNWCDQEWWYVEQSRRVRLGFDSKGLQIVDVDGNKGDPLYAYRH